MARAPYKSAKEWRGCSFKCSEWLRHTPILVQFLLSFSYFEQALKTKYTFHWTIIDQPCGKLIVVDYKQALPWQQANNQKINASSSLVALTVMASLVQLVWPWPDHFSADRWSHSQTAGTLWRLGQVPHTSSPLPCMYVFLVIVPALFPVDQEPGASPNGLYRHPRILIPQAVFTAAHCLL